MAATSSAPGESRDATITRGEDTTARESDHEEGVGDGGSAVPTFPWLNPGGLFTDTLFSAEGEDREVHGPAEPLPDRGGADEAREDKEGDVSNLVQRSGRK